MKKRIDKLINWLPNDIGIILILIFICVPSIYIGFCSYHKGYINEAQLGYLGSVIGGGITLLGVYFTICHTNEINKQQKEQHDIERKEELATQYKPILILSDDYDDPDIKQKFKSNIDFYRIHLRLKNVGRGEAYNVRISPLIDNNILECKINRFEFIEFPILVANGIGVSIEILLNINSHNSDDKLTTNRLKNLNIKIQYTCPFSGINTELISTINLQTSRKNKVYIENKIIEEAK